MKRVRVLSRLLALLLAADPAAVAADSPQSPQALDPPANLVNVDVVVHDRSGRPVTDLQAADFDVQEDGKRMAVERAAYNGEATDRREDPARAPRIFVAVIDRERLAEGTFTRAKRAAAALFTTQFRTGDLGAVVIDGAATTSSLTTNREELLAAVAQLRPAPKTASAAADLREWPQLTEAEVLRVAADEPATIAVVTERACNDDPSRCPALDRTGLAEQAVRAKAARIAAVLRAISGRVVTQMLALLTRLERMEGRKGILLLSENLAADPSSPLVQQTIASAARANARVYTLSAAGDSADALGAATGGVVARSMNELDALPAQIAADASFYYAVMYRSERPPDGTFRRVNVTVKRAGATARARRGYIATRAAEVTTAAPSGATPSSLSPSVAAPRDAPTTRETGIESVPPVMAPPLATTVDGVVVPAPASSTAILRVRPTASTNVTTLAGGVAPEADAAAGWDAYQRGDLETARTRLLPVAARPRAPAWVHYALGMADFALRYFEDAVIEWEKVYTTDPQFEPVYFDLFDAYVQTKQHDKALRLLRAAKARWPRDPDVFNALATLQGADGAFDDAIKTLQEAIAVAPTEATTYFNMAKVLELRYFRSRRYFKQTASWVANESDREKAIKNYERYLEMKGQYPDLAHEALERLTAISPKPRP